MHTKNIHCMQKMMSNKTDKPENRNKTLTRAHSKAEIYKKNTLEGVSFKKNPTTRRGSVEDHPLSSDFIMCR